MPRESIDFDQQRPGLPWRLILSLVVCIAALGGLGYYTWTLRVTHLETKDELAQTKLDKARLGGQRDRAHRLGKELADCRAEATAAAQQVEQTTGNLDATRAELAELRKQRAEAAKRLDAFKQLTAKFQKMIDSGKLDVVVRDGRMIVKLPAGVLFDSGKAELSRDGELALMEVAVILRQIGDRKFMVAGHTDSRPLEGAKSRYQNNWELSAARAVTVTQFLIEARIPAGNLVAAGYGEHDPVGDNKTKSGRQQNRRIEIVLLPNLDELPQIPVEVALGSGGNAKAK